MKRFILMVQFMTTIPVPVDLKANEKDFGKGLVWAPAVGLMIGGILFMLHTLISFVFPVFPSAVLVVVAYVVLTGGLHLDGLGDAFDGLFSGGSPGRMLEIMRDSRIGTFGMLAVVSVILIDISMINAFSESFKLYRVLLLFPVAGRTTCVMGAGFFRYARNTGLGSGFVNYCGIKHAVTGLVFHFLIFAVIAGAEGIAAAAVAAVTGWFVLLMLSRRVSGVTGDILGCACELNQMIFLLAAYLACAII